MDTTSDSVLVERVGGWLQRLGTKDFEVRPLAGDVSPRRYLRVHASDATFVVAAYPESMLDTAHRFVETTELMEAAGVRVPEILAFDEEAGLMLLEDAGPETLYDCRRQGWESMRRILAAARDTVARIQLLDAGRVAAINPTLGAKALLSELEMTWKLHLEPSGLCGSGKTPDRLQTCLEALCGELEDAGLVPCHRDFMARNLVPLTSCHQVLVLDHQDLRLGPGAYDLACLTNDSLFLPPDRCREIAGDEEVSSAQYRRCAAQRSLKIVGTFVSFSQRGSSRYLPWIDTCLARAFDYLTSLPEGEELAEPLAPLWRPGSGS